MQLDLTAYQILPDISSWQWQEQSKKHFFHLPDSHFPVHNLNLMLTKCSLGLNFTLIHSHV